MLEGYFLDQPHRRTYVQIEESRASLILKVGEGAPAEEPTTLPLAHAQALLAVSQGHVEYLRTRLSIGSHEIQALHVVRPGPLDLVVVAATPENGQDLPPLPWFGPEVSAEPAYQRRRLALDGAPNTSEVDVSNAALNSLLDLLEDRFTTWPGPHDATRSDELAADVTPQPKTSAPAPNIEAHQEIDELRIEDEVIRELARSLHPRQR